jgi:molecular chaperone GrpE (heat shock protein)
MNGTDFTPVLVELATGVWRLRGRLAANEPGETDDSAKLMRSLKRQLTSMADALHDAGVQVQDHTGEPFDAGQSVDVVAYAASNDVGRETVTETITPTVYINGHIVQRGQIVVAGPDPDHAPAPNDGEG